MEFLTRTPSGAGNSQIFTLSTWIKRGLLSATSGSQNIFESRPGSYFLFVFTNASNASGGDTIRFEASGGMNLGIDGLFRDPSAWYHVVAAVDTTQSTASNRVKFYVNGEQRGLNSTYTTYPSQNDSFQWNSNVIQCVGGSQAQSGEGFDGYLADTYNIDGQQLTAASFGETDSTTGIWIPKTYSGTYGTNGFRLEYRNAAALGTDTSGQGNNFTPQNMSADNQVTDTPDNNFATMNPVVIFEGSNSPSNIPTYSEGNTVATADNSTTRFGMGTIATTMPYYFEVKVLSTSSTDTSQRIGVIDDSAYGSPATYSSVYRGDGSITATGESNNTGNQTLSANSIIGIAVDLATNYNIKYYHNGTLQATMAVGSSYRSLATTAFTRLVDSTQSFSFNFGNPSFAISSGNADANGYGNFEYAVPSGYYALCTKNLNTYG
tara:strand:+ start:381 stop:1685 length:1305 start_codon:yes stop_codon:yes gene_type:complete